MLDAAIAARDQSRLTTLPEIAEVTVTCPEALRDEQFVAATHKRRPSQIVEAQFALPYLIAVALVHGALASMKSPIFATPRCWTSPRE